MDLSKLADLKEKLVTTTKFISVWEHFLDHFGENPAFIKLGERVRHPFLEAVFTRIVGDRRVVVQRNDARAARSFDESARGTHRRGGGRKTVA